MGKENSATDALFRLLHCMAVSVVNFWEWDDLQEEVLTDEQLKNIMQGLISQRPTPIGYAAS